MLNISLSASILQNCELKVVCMRRLHIAQSALYVVFLIQILIDKTAGLGQIGKPPEKSLFENIHHVHPRRETIILKNNGFCKDT